MDTIRLGRTNLTVNKNGFGALPVQRVSMEEAGYLLRKAYDNGINYFDTARSYTDSEEKMGNALADVRENIIISTKTHSKTVEEFWQHLHTSLRLLQTDYIDIYQFHNPAFCPKPGDGTGLYEAMLEAREKGMIRFIGMTNHRLAVAEELTPDAPLILDDALVRFDDIRMRAAVSILRELAENRQVILFTCQGREADV